MRNMKHTKAQEQGDTIAETIRERVDAKSYTIYEDYGPAPVGPDRIIDVVGVHPTVEVPEKYLHLLRLYCNNIDRDLKAIGY